MDKKVLKSILQSLTVGNEISVNFRKASNTQSGNYRVMDLRRGRGKFASLIASMQSVDNADLSPVSLNTKYSDDVLNIVVEGTMYGYENESAVPTVYIPNIERAVQYKELFTSMLDAENNDYSVMLKSSQVSEFNGLFSVVEAHKSRGRNGQVVLKLSNAQGAMFEVWSYRHSGVIDSIERA